MKECGKTATIAAFVLGLALCVPQARAQEKPYPTKQITYLLCFEPGGQSDRIARIQQPHLERILGQKVIIDYKAGGSGSLGWREMVNSRPDGYLMAGINVPSIIIGPMQQETGYKTDQIAPVCLFEQTPMGLAVLNTSPIKTVKEFVEHAKKNPGLTVTGAGLFGAHHVGAMRFARMGGIKLSFVPFNGAAPAMTAFGGACVLLLRSLG